MRRRLLALLLCAVAVAWVVVALLTYRDAQREIDLLLDAHLEQAARLLVAQSGHEIEELDFEDEEHASRYAAAVAFQVWRRGDALRLRSANAPVTRLSATDRGFSDTTIAGTHWRVFSAWDAEHELLVQAGEDHATRDRIAQGIALNTLLPLLLALPLLAAALWWLVTRGLRPLGSLSDELAQRGAQDLEPLVARGLPQEIAPFVDRLNNLFLRIQDSLAAERRFTSHAAHELRTPIAAVRAQAEVARASTEPSQRQAALDRAIEACDRAGRLMEQLLLLARADEAQLEASGSRCDLRVIAERLLAELAPAAMRAGVALSLDGDAGPVIVDGDAVLLEAALRNVVDNAVRHGAAGAEVRVRVTSAGGQVSVVVEDDGPGVSDADLERLGQRFYRAGDATASGTGLGLSIVARIATLHGGSLRLFGGSAVRGFKVELRLPAAR